MGDRQFYFPFSSGVRLDPNDNALGCRGWVIIISLAQNALRVFHPNHRLLGYAQVHSDKVVLTDLFFKKYGEMESRGVAVQGYLSDMGKAARQLFDTTEA